VSGTVARRCTLAAVVAAVAVGAAARPMAAQLEPTGRRRFDAALEVSAAEHRVEAGEGIERSAGALVRGELRYALRSWLELRGGGGAGRLAARTDPAADRTVSELGVGAAVAPLPWLELDAGTTVRRYASALADQRWVRVHVGAETRVPLLGDGPRGDRLLGVVRAALLPVVSVTGQPGPGLALAAGTGLEAHRDRLSAALAYSLERYDFPAVLRAHDGARVRRLEQLSTVGVRVGVRF